MTRREPFLLAIALIAGLSAAATPAAAFGVTARATASAGVSEAPPPGSVANDGDFVSSADPVGPPASASAAIGIDYTTVPEGLPIVISGSADASADARDLRVRTAIEMLDYDGSLVGEGLFANAFTSRREDVTFDWSTAPELLYLRPVYAVDGTVSVSGGASATVRFSYSWSGSGVFGEATLLRGDAPADGTLLDFTGVLAPAFPVLPGSMVQTQEILAAESRVTFGDLASGDHAAEVAFESTIRFRGYEVFEDEALTRRYAGPISIRTADGRSITVVPEPGTAVFMGVGLLALSAGRAPRSAPALLGDGRRRA